MPDYVAGGCEAVAALTQADVAGEETGREMRFREVATGVLSCSHLASPPAWLDPPQGRSGLSLDKLRRGPSIRSSAGTS